MRILDTYGVIAAVGEKKTDDVFLENGAFAFGKECDDIVEISDYCFFDSLKLERYKDRIRIPRIVTHSFLESCDETGYIPLIIHNHEKSRDKSAVDFSYPDKWYMYSICNHLHSFEKISYCLFVVTDGERARVSLWRKGMNNGIYGEMWRRTDSLSPIYEIGRGVV